MDHKLTKIDTEKRTAKCSICGPVKIHAKGNGRWRCAIRSRDTKRAWLQQNPDKHGNWRTPEGHAWLHRYRKHLKDHCERCGFVPEDICQLEIHHKDGDRKNDTHSNLLTLCSNCHQLVEACLARGVVIPAYRVRRRKRVPALAQVAAEQ